MRASVVTRTTGIVAAFSAAIVGLTASPALAVESEDVAVQGRDVTVWSQDWTGGNLAEARFRSYGDSISACDRYTDGKRAGAEVSWATGSGNYRMTVFDTNGSNGDCKTRSDIDIPEGTSVTTKAWTQDGSSGSRERVASSSYGIA